MALTIRMRIDENDEHSYYYATGSGTEIELIPLVVDENGVFVPDEGKAYNRVTVNVPETELETLIVDANGTYNAPDGKAYDVVTVNVQQIINLQDKSASYSANGNYTIQADSGYDGLGTVSVAVDVPEPVMPEIESSKQETITENGIFTISPSTGYDAMEEVVVDVSIPTGGGDIFATEFTPTGGAEYINLSKGVMPTAIYVVTKDFSTIMNGGGRYQALQYAIAVDPETSGYYLKMYCYKGSTNSTTSQSASSSRTNMMQSVPTNNSATMLVYDSANDRIGYYGKAYNDTGTSYGFANGCKYQLFAIY